MATGTSMLGMRLLDVLATNSNEVASFGNTSSNVVIRIYDCNAPLTTGYVMGLSNNSFAIAKASAPLSTQVGIGTFAPSSSAQLHVQGTVATSNIISYTADKTINFPGMTLAGISNINLTGNITVAGVPFGTGQWDAQSGSNMYTYYNIGIGTNNPVGGFHVVKGNAHFACNVGIGTTVAPSNLTVQGNALVSGSITVGQLIDQSARSGSYNSWNMLGADGAGAKTLLTNDPTPSNRVLFSFSLLLGQYLITANIPYKNLTSLVSIDNYNWATIGLYQCTPATFYDTLPPLYTVPLVALGNDSSDFDTCSFNTFLQVSTNLGTNYVIAVTGKGHQLQIGGTGLPKPIVNTIPIRGIGTDDNISVRQQLQMSPIRTSFTTTAGQQTLNAYADGVYSVSGSNVDVYINGTKYIWRNGASSDYTVSTSVLNNVTTFAVNLSTPLDAGNEVDLVIWPSIDSYNVYTSGYLYQSINNYSVKWLNVNGGGVRTAERLIVDGDLIVGGNVFFGCNTTLFPSGAVWSGDNTSITSNIIGTGNIIDGAITGAKIMDGSVTNSKIATASITADKFAANTVTSNVIAYRSVSVDDIDFTSGRVGIGSLSPRSPLDVNGSIITNNSVVVASSNQNISYDFVQSTTANAPLMTIQTSNFKSLPTPVICVEANFLSNIASGASVAAWGPYTSNVLGPLYYSDSGWLNGGYIQFLPSRSMRIPGSSTFNFSTSGGLTVISLVRFDTLSPATVNDGDRVFTLSQSGGNSIYLVRSPTNTTLMNLVMSSYTIPIGSNVINTREWAVYGLTVPSQNGGTICLYKNGRLVGTSSMPFSWNTSYAFDNVTLATNGTVYGSLSYGGIHMYDGVLTPEQLTAVTNYFTQGSANVIANARPLIQANPIPYATGDVITGAPAQSFDVVGNMRVRALPTDPLWAIDVYSPISRFANRTSLPTFNFGVDGATAGIDISGGNYLGLESGYYRTGTQGTTFLIKYKFTATVTSSNEPLLYVGVDAVQATTTNPYILIARDGYSAGLKVSIRNGNGQIAQVNATMSSSTTQYDIQSVAVVIDPSAKGTLTTWVNGAVNSTTANIASSAFGLFQDRFYNNVYIGWSGSNVNTTTVTVYSASAYNRALSATEIRQAFAVLGTDTQFSSADLGSRTGRSALAVSREGYITPFTMSPDTIPGLIAYLPFDNHIFDATSGINWVGNPIVTGNVQFNNKSRIGPGLRLDNRYSTVNYITYPVNYTLFTGTSGWTVCMWMNIYSYISGNYSALCSFTNPSGGLTLNVIVFSPPSIRINLFDQINSNVGVDIAPTLVSSNVWYHVAIAVGTNSQGIYLNGSLLSSASTTIQQCAVSTFMIGSKYDGSQGFTGEFDDFRVYNRVLTADEIRVLASVPARASTMAFNSAGNGTPSLSVNTGAVQVAAPLQLSQTTTLDSVVTNTTNMTSTVNMTTQAFELQDLTGIQQNIQLGPGMTTSNISPFTNITTEGCITLPGTTTGYLSLSDSRYVFNWWETPFALEMWVNYSTFANASFLYNGVTTVPGLIGMTNVAGTYSWMFGADSSGALTFYYYNGLNGTAVRKGTPTVMNTNTWYHIAVTCDNTTIRTFVNGSLEGSALVSASTPSAVTSTPLTIGYFGTTAVTKACVTNIRLMKGVFLYSTNFTPSTTPLSLASSGSNLLLLRNTMNLQTPLTLTSDGNMTVAGNISAGNLGMFRNRVINGDMRIDQRSSGAAWTNITSSVSTMIMTADRTRLELNNAGTYTLQQVTDAPPGFTNSLRVTVTSNVTYGPASYSMFTHKIEGYNVADFNLGTSYASPFAVSFWAKSSVTGTYGLCVDNNTSESSTTNGTRGYTTTFSIAYENVWEQKVLIIPGETSGTWNKNSNVGMRVAISFGTGSSFANTSNNQWTTSANKMHTTNNIQLGATTNGAATFAITGLQVEKGTIATPFEYRPYPVELAMCQRYCTRLSAASTLSRFSGTAIGTSPGSAFALVSLPTQLRVVPDLGTLTTGGTLGLMGGGTSFTATFGSLSGNGSSLYTVYITVSNASIVSGTTYHIYANNSPSAYLQIDVEL